MRTVIRSTFLLLAAILTTANAQTTTEPQQQQVASVVSSSASKPANLPVYTDYRGIKIGMTADEVRAKLDHIKKGDHQDFLVFSEHESAQIYYDDNNKVTAISIDYFGGNSDAPAPEAVLGAGIQAKPDGSMYS